MKHELRLSEIVGYESKADLLAKDHPAEIRRVIERFYVEGMLGGAIYRRPGFLRYHASGMTAYAARLWRLLQRLITVLIWFE